MSDKIYPSMVIRSQAEAIELLQQENNQLKDRINKAVEHISNEFLCYDNESDEYIQGLKAIDLLKGDKE